RGATLIALRGLDEAVDGEGGDADERDLREDAAKRRLNRLGRGVGRGCRHARRLRCRRSRGRALLLARLVLGLLLLAQLLHGLLDRRLRGHARELYRSLRTPRWRGFVELVLLRRRA